MAATQPPADSEPTRTFRTQGDWTPEEGHGTVARLRSPRYRPAGGRAVSPFYRGKWWPSRYSWWDRMRHRAIRWMKERDLW